jgi:hypothetical protein
VPYKFLFLKKLFVPRTTICMQRITTIFFEDINKSHKTINDVIVDLCLICAF